MDNVLKLDEKRYGNKSEMPFFQYCYRKAQLSNGGVFWRILLKISRVFNCVDMAWNTQIGAGLYIGHPYAIVINPKAILGKNINLHKGVTIGQENRGKRKGTPTIGNNVWIGVNATIVGKIIIGDDVLIAPNSYVNCDIPSHSIVFGNPCIIKHCDNATDDYINRTI